MFGNLKQKIALRKRRKLIKCRFPNSQVSEMSKFDEKTTLSGFNVICKSANISKSTIGYCSVVGANSYLPNCIIGSFCSIADEVAVVHFTHPTDLVSTYPSFFNTMNDYPFGKSSLSFNEEIILNSGHYVEIGNDVWIGKNVLIKGGVKIGDGAIIGMGAVVTKDVPPYSVVCGVPAKVIKMRFDESIIRSLLLIQWWNWDINDIKNRKEDFSNIKTFIRKYGKE